MVISQDNESVRVSVCVGVRVCLLCVFVDVCAWER